jgi:hypothetical protein
MFGVEGGNEVVLLVVVVGLVVLMEGVSSMAQTASF